MRRPALVALAALAACSNKPPPPTIGFHEPTAVAAFSGWTPEKPRQAYPVPQPYLAVANGRADELRIIDLVTQQPLESPGFAYALSVPTHPRPLYLAAASLGDAQPDLLAVAGVGAVVDLVTTWEDGSDPSGGGMGVIRSYDLSAVAGTGAQILSMVATPVPGVPAGIPPVAPPQPGQARLILGFSGSTDGNGGKLVVMDFVRGPGGSVQLGAPVQVKPLGASPSTPGPDPVSLAVGPDLFHLYLATPDVITDLPLGPGSRQVQGVAELDMSGGAAAPWPVRGLDARAPTTLVAAAILGERTPTYVCGPPPATCPPSGPDVFSQPALRVYAALDPAGCGSERPINCGIAVIDPSLGGLAADLAPGGTIVPAQSYRAPMFVPAVPLTMSIALPAASGALQCIDEASCPAQNYRQPLMQLIANGVRWTPAVAAVGASDGRTYLMDLGRSGPASDVSLLNGAATRVQVVSAYSLTPLQPDGSAAKAGLGLYRQYPPTGESPGLTTDATKLPQAVVVTPGFTRGDTWSLVWQGFLPGLQAKDFVLGLESDGSLYLAFQTETIGGNQWDVGAYVGNPELAIHAADASPPGDLVQFTLPVDQVGTGGNPCPLATGTKYEAVIASILPVAANHPGGALKLVLPSSPTSDPFCILWLQSWLVSHPPTPPATTTFLTGTDGGVRASGLVLSGMATGYVGRPPMLTQADVNGGPTAIATKRFNFAWQDETALTGEMLSVTRKARRFFYANDDFFGGVSGGAYTETGGDPLKAGPVLGLIAGPMCSDQPSAGLQAICPDTRLGDLLRDSSLVFTTIGGVLPSYRSPTPSSLPSSSLAFDRSQFPDDTFGSVFYVTYRQDAVLVAVPGQTLNISGTLR